MIPFRFLIALTGCLMLPLPTASAQTDFQRLLARVPSSANAVVILNVEKAKQSPAGLAEGLAAKLETAFQEGLICVPPSSSRFVLAAEMDLEFMSPIWEAAVMDFAEAPTMSLIAKAYKGQSDTVEGLSAVVLPQDAYVVKLADKTLGAMWPANRQNVVRWARQQKTASLGPVSSYVQRAAGYSDRAGSEIIMALDLDGMISPQRAKTYLQSVAWLEEAKVDVAKLNQLLASVEGIRVGVRLGNPPIGRVTVDFKEAPTIAASLVKRLFLEYLSEKGMLIDDFAKWQPEVQNNTITLGGNMSMAGIRKLMSVIESPAPTPASSESASATPTANDTAAQAAKTKTYFKTVTSMFDDLKDDMQDAKNLASTSQYFDKYARRIERMPILDVDPDMLDYGAYVAQQMRQASGAVRMMGIRTGVRTRDINSSNTGVAADEYYYGGYGYGRYGNGVDTVKAVEQQRGAVRAQERGNTAANVHEIRAQVIAATSDIRRKMTEKYKVQF